MHNIVTGVTTEHVQNTYNKYSKVGKKRTIKKKKINPKEDKKERIEEQ